MSGFAVGKAARDLWAQRRLIRQFVRREVEARYRGSTLGWRWSLLNPLLLLAVYTFVFGVVFRARWPQFAATAWGSSRWCSSAGCSCSTCSRSASRARPASS